MDNLFIIDSTFAIISAIIAVFFFIFPDSKETTRGILQRIFKSWIPWAAIAVFLAGIAFGRSYFPQTEKRTVEVTREVEIPVTVEVTRIVQAEEISSQTESALLVPTRTPLQAAQTNTLTTLTSTPSISIQTQAPTPTSIPIAVSFHDSFENAEIKPEWEYLGDGKYPKFTEDGMVLSPGGSFSLIIGEDNWNNYIIEVDVKLPDIEDEPKPSDNRRRANIIFARCEDNSGVVKYGSLVLLVDSENTGRAFFGQTNSDGGGDVIPEREEGLNIFTPGTIVPVRLQVNGNKLIETVNKKTLPPQHNILKSDDKACWQQGSDTHFSGKVGITSTSNWSGRFDNFSIRSIDLGED
ncbi:MAG: hypothetical protein AAF902_00910 [Chloroflexota bacterium]